MITVSIKGLCTGYGKGRRQRVVAQGLTGELHGGELCCLLGRNGGGKSTLIKTLAGFLAPLGGEAEIMGESIVGMKPQVMSKKVSVVLTDRVDLPHTRVWELVALGRSPYTGLTGRMGEEDRKMVERALESVGVSGLRDRYISDLSDGERQKAFVAKAFAQDTPVIILDEPTSFLDYPSKVAVMSMARALARESGKTILMSTHDLEIALRLADRVWLLDQAHGLKSGTPDELRTSGALQDYFGDMPG